MHKGRFSVSVIRQLVVAVPLAAALLCIPTPGFATSILTSDLASFAVLGASTVTNVSPSTIVGNVGVWSSGGANAISGFNSSPGVAVSDPQVTGGLVHAGTIAGTPNAATAQGELTTARTNLGLLGPGTLLPVDVTGLTIFPGVFTIPAGTTNLSGAVTLDGQGNANAFWLFQTDALTTATGSVVNVINTGTGAGVFWNDASSVTLGSSTSFQGNILALTSIGLVTTAKIGCGRALADVGAVTLQKNTIGIGCGPGTGGVAGSNGFSGSGLNFETTGGGSSVVVINTQGPIVSVPGTFEVTAVPEPATLTLLGLGLVGVARWKRRRMGSRQP